MKVLVVSVPAGGHLNPLLPLVGAMLAGGDQVVVASGIDPGAAVTGSGAEFRAAGHGEMDWFATLQSRTRGAPGDGLRPERINHYFIPRLFGEVAADDMIDDLLTLGRELRPDVVVFETYALAAPLAAELLGVPAVHHLISPPLDPAVAELVDDAICPLWRSFGRSSPGYAGLYRGLTLEVTPPSLAAHEVPGESLAMRPVPMPVHSDGRSTPPLVYLTLGTFFGGNTAVFRTVLDALGEEPVNVLVTVGADQDPSQLGPVPPNARVERFVPQAEVLPRCSAVIHHGGSGTMFGSLAHGLPQVVLPQGADNFVNGELLVRAGLGISIDPVDVSVDSVRTAVRQLLDRPAYHEAGRRVAAEMSRMADPKSVAEELRRRFG